MIPPAAESRIDESENIESPHMPGINPPTAEPMKNPGIPGLRITGDKGGVQINPDYDAEPNSYSIKRVFRNGKEIWRA
jgi:hypothetical protein